MSYETIRTFGWFDGKCNECGEPVLVNRIAEGPYNNQDHPSKSWCTCSDRATNPEKVLTGKTTFLKEIRKCP